MSHLTLVVLYTVAAVVSEVRKQLYVQKTQVEI